MRLEVQDTAKNVAPVTLRRSGKGFGLERASVLPCHSRSRHLRYLPSERLREEFVLNFGGREGAQCSATYRASVYTPFGERFGRLLIFRRG